jgi:hypothetical protein
MKTLLAFLLLCGAGFAATDTPLIPVRIREVSLRNVPLKEGERIAAIKVEVTGARFRGVRIPDDWGVDVGAPSADVSVLKGVAQHGTAMLFTTDEFQRFLTLAFYDYGKFNRHSATPLIFPKSPTMLPLNMAQLFKKTVCPLGGRG